MKSFRRFFLIPAAVAGCAALVLATPLQAGPSDVVSDAEFQAQSRHITSLQKIINSLHKR